ncbi:MAG: methylmalonyl-CoA mutase family protein, partial [Pseudomonadota bacterium]
MADGTLSLSANFENATEADWLAAVDKALKGGGIERITRRTRDDIAIRPLYRETDFESGQDLRGTPGAAPFLRGANSEPDPYLQWDIRQSFSHPDPRVTNQEILRDLERGVTSINLAIECSGERGCIITDLAGLKTALSGVRADIATVSLAHRGAGSGASAAALLAMWAEGHDTPSAQKLAFNISTTRQLMLNGKIAGGIDAAMARTAALVKVLAAKFPAATGLAIDGQFPHEAGGSEAQELGVLIADAVDTMRRLDMAGL